MKLPYIFLCCFYKFFVLHITNILTVAFSFCVYFSLYMGIALSLLGVWKCYIIYICEYFATITDSTSSKVNVDNPKHTTCIFKKCKHTQSKAFLTFTRTKKTSKNGLNCFLQCLEILNAPIVNNCQLFEATESVPSLLHITLHSNFSHWYAFHNSPNDENTFVVSKVDPSVSS